MERIQSNGVANAMLHQKYLEDYSDLTKAVEGYKVQRKKIVATIGSFDVLHIGHLRYLTRASMQGDILVVGVDSDHIIKQLKGRSRPIIPSVERVEMLAYQQCVDLITLIDDLDVRGHWQYGLLDRIRPDVFVAEESSYSDIQLAEIEKYCGKVVVFPRQAEGTSTSQIIQSTIKAHPEEIQKLVAKFAEETRS